ncbi:MAG: FxLYD domain-containing protein [Kiloniellales bacterium]
MLIAGTGLGGYLARDHIIQVYPDAAELFALFLTSPDPPGAGLALGKLESERRREDGVPILVIRGEIANPSIRPRDVPQLKGVLYGADGQELQSWRFTAPEAKLLAGDSVRFQTEVRNPPVKATDLKISFVTE